MVARPPTRSSPARTLAFVTALTLAAIALLGAKPPSGGGGSAAAQVRVNQVGYAVAAGKRAYLMSGGVETGATFAVKSGAATVLTGPIGPDLGAWSNSYGHVYAIDFDAVGVGTYTIAVTGPAAATSPSFTVAAGSSIDAQPLRNALAYYQVQRDGVSYVPSALRAAPAHLNDATAATYTTPNVNRNGGFRGDLTALGTSIDASGGWWDAGDYLKFLHATTYADALLLTGVRDFPNQMGVGAGAAGDFTAEARFGADWILRMWDDPNRTLYYQVGIGGGNGKTISDHDIWRLPQADDTFGGSDPLYRYIRHRPVFRAGPPGSSISPNLAGRTSAALALAYQVYRTSDPAFAGKALVAAEHIFDLANTTPGQLTTAIPFEFYPETEWRDDLELGATELHRALALGGSLPTGLAHTDPAFYLGAAATWANAYITGPNDADDTLNLYDVSGLAHFELDRAITAAGDSAGLAVSHAGLRADLKKALDGALAQGAGDPFGFGFPWGVWDTTTHGAGLSVMASEYDQLTGTTAYAAQADRWLANILGANGWGLSLIVGDGTTFPHCLQHQVANLAGSLDGTGAVLAGAAVEGPNGGATSGSLSGMRACPTNGVDVYAPFNGKTSQFKDDVQSYSNTEPAIDLTATSPLAFARQSAGIR